MVQDRTGNLYISGSSLGTGTLDFGDTTLSIPSNTLVAFIAKFDAQGNFLQLVQEAKSSGDLGISGMFVDDLGNCLITGDFKDNLTIGDTVFTSSAYYEGYLAKIDPSGHLVWINRFESNFFNAGTDVLSNKNGDIYVCGRSRGTTIFDNLTSLSTGNTVGFVAKLDSQGNYLWVNPVGVSTGVGWVLPYYLSFDPNQEYIYLGGEFWNTLYLGSDTLSTLNNQWQQILFTKFDQNGQFIWGKQAGNPNWETDLSGFSVDAKGNWYLVGDFWQTAYFDNHSVSSEGYYDIYVAKLVSEETTDPPMGIGATVIPEDEISIFPNPTRDKLFIESKVKLSRFVLSDAKGAVLLRREITGVHPYLNLKGIPSGTYFLELFDEHENHAVKKVVKL